MFQHSPPMRDLPTVKRSGGAMLMSTQGRLDPVDVGAPRPLLKRLGPITLEADDVRIAPATSSVGMRRGFFTVAVRHGFLLGSHDRGRV
jgi:hypothetical protein